MATGVKKAARRPAAEGWGQGLAAYPEEMQKWLPGLHQAFNYLNKYLSVPALRMGLGRYMSNPLTGYLMILRTRGRKSGTMRDAPLGYVIVGDAVYCMAGFGRRTHWFQNIQADPRVEVILPGRSFSGTAEEVTEEAEALAILPPLLRSMGLVAGSMGMGNVWKMTPAEMAAKCEGLPLVRIRATGVAAGPDDPGGQFWVVPTVLSVLGLAWWLRRRGRSR
jgi:deazaflavin-dependent oxidoreductase (nitroreductase family)